MSFILALIEWIKELLGLGCKPIKLGERVFMPLFYRNLNGRPDATWNYLPKSDAERAHLRRYITETAMPHETPAIAFCLTPSNVSGGLVDNKMLAVTDDKLDELEAKCKELVEDGIAVFLCLYVDDADPRWWLIAQPEHASIWRRIHERIGKKYVTGAILSIETNEAAVNVVQIENCLGVMREAMPGLDWYGTHLQFASRGGCYSWTGANGPASANIIFMETQNDPHNDDAGELIKRNFNAVKAANPPQKIVVHEYNLNVGSVNQIAQRKWLRENGAWGVA